MLKFLSKTQVKANPTAPKVVKIEPIGPKARRKAAAAAGKEEKKQTPKKEEKIWDYWPIVIGPTRSAAYYKFLLAYVKEKTGDKEKQLKHIFGDKKKDGTPKTPRMEHRLVAYCATPEESKKVYKYSGTVQESTGWPDPMQELADEAVKIVNFYETKLPENKRLKKPPVFPRGLIIVYKDGTKHTGFHRDEDAMEGYIVSFSFYESCESECRTFRVKRDGVSNYVDSFLMANGSAVVMLPGMQQTHTHAAIEEKKKKDGRVNVTLRMSLGG